MDYNHLVNILVARTEKDIELAYGRLRSAAALGCDTETSALNAKYGRLFSIQFSDGDFNVLVPTSEGVPAGKLSLILEDPAIVKIFHNAKFDLEFLNENGYEVRNVFDTMIAEKVLTRGANQSASLAETLYRYFAVDLDKLHPFGNDAPVAVTVHTRILQGMLQVEERAHLLTRIAGVDQHGSHR